MYSKARILGLWNPRPVLCPMHHADFQRDPWELLMISSRAELKWEITTEFAAWPLVHRED